jgi:hypothetical protein
MLVELASTENVSSCGVRIRSKLLWKPETHLFAKLSTGQSWMRARVAYCQMLPTKTHALGLEFYATAHRYNVTFRCIHCGKYEASINFRSDRIEGKELIKARIYPVRCSACGGKSDACGFSAVRILHYKSKEIYSADQNAFRINQVNS